jgi:hypothetical protein
MPPIVAFADDAEPGRYWLADGWHRIEAQWDEDLTEVEVEVHPGGRVDAMLYAASANTTHGKRRDRPDSIAAAIVAIRALSLQNPETRPTWDAVRAAARVGTETVKAAFAELEERQEREARRQAWAAERDAREQEAPAPPPLPPKDPRGGARDFGTPVANPNGDPTALTAEGLLPVVDLETGEVVTDRVAPPGATSPTDTALMDTRFRAGEAEHEMVVLRNKIRWRLENRRRVRAKALITHQDEVERDGWLGAARAAREMLDAIVEEFPDIEQEMLATPSLREER